MRGGKREGEKKIISKLFDLSKRTVIVTGATGLLGPEFARILSEAGANVVLVGLWQATKNKDLQEELKSMYGTSPSAIEADISKQPEVRKLMKQVIAKYGRIDGLVNNAQFVAKGYPRRAAPFESYPLDLWNDIIETNLTGVFLSCQEAGRIMAAQKSGSIVNVSSIYGLVGTDQRIYGKSMLNSPPSYAASKAGILNLTRYLAAYWHRKNVRVNSLTLGGVFNGQDSVFVRKYSEKTMMGRMADKSEYSAAVLFLISDAASYMTGANMVIDGGWTAW